MSLPAPAPVGFSVHLRGATAGPYAPWELQGMVRMRLVSAETPVRSTAGGGWFPAGNLDGLFSRRSWTTAMVLSAVLGLVGADRFYLGHGGLGVVKLLTFGGFGVWWLVDLVNLASRSTTDGDGLPLVTGGAAR